MHVGGGGRERWMVLLPVAGLTVLLTVMLGGPEEALVALESTFDAAWDAASMLLRR